MSVQIMADVFKIKMANATTKFVLICMANYANAGSLCAWPSIETLQNDTCLNKKTIHRAISELIELGYLIDTGKREGKTKRTTVYQLNVCLNSTKNGIVPKTESFQKRNSSNLGEEIDPKTVQSIDPKTVQSYNKDITVIGTVNKNRYSGTRLPFEEIPDEWRSWASKEKLWSNDITLDVWENFKDHWLGKSGPSSKKKNWNATWRNWVRKENIKPSQKPSGMGGMRNATII